MNCCYALAAVAYTLLGIAVLAVLMSVAGCASNVQHRTDSAPFIGTTNQDSYIKDQTGGRRYWPVKCTSIDVAGLAGVREQLFAEAVIRFRMGDRWWPTAEDEARFFKPQQDKRLDDDPWHPVIESWVQIRADADLKDPRFTVSDVAKGCLGFIGDSRIDTKEARRISSVLRDLGCAEPPRTGKGRWFLPPAKEVTE